MAFETLPKNSKLHCDNSIYIAYQNRESGKDSILAREYLRKIRDFLIEHYAVKPPACRWRIYVSRGNR